MATAQIAIRLSRNSSLGFGYRFNDHLRFFEKFIEAPAGHGITACVDDERRFDEISGGDTAVRIALDRASGLHFRLVAQNGN